MTTYAPLLPSRAPGRSQDKRPARHDPASHAELAAVERRPHTNADTSAHGSWRFGGWTEACLLVAGLFLLGGCKDHIGPPPTGTALVTVTTTGPGADTTSHYSLSVDGGKALLIPANVALNIAGMSLGTHSVTLAGMPSNCTVSQNTQTVTIREGAVAAVPFAVSCAIPTGYLKITAVTTGADIDPKGYTLSVDNQTQPLGVNATVVIANVVVGGHYVALSGLAGNCTVAGPNPTNATVANGDTARITFSVSCVALGALRVTTVTTGVDLDLNGYTVLLEGQQRATVPTNGTVAVSLAAGTHTLALGDISSNCTVTGSNPQSVVIPVHDTARVTFQLACVKTTRLAFTSVPDYYTGYTEIWVINGDGTSLVQLTHDTGHDGGAAWSPDGSKIAFHTNRDGNFEVYAMNADGTGLVNLTNSSAVDSGPAWSPDGNKIAFYSNRDGSDGLYVMNADGSGVSKLTSGTGGFHPAWSPSGTQIAYGCHIDVANVDVCVINADGTGAARLTTDAAWDYEPAWKPDGTKILFVTGRYPSALQLALMNPDGTSVTALGANTGTGVNDPAWSSDGKKIAFHTLFSSCGSSSCYTTDIIDVANADGTNATYLVDGSQPAWRP